MSNDNKKPGKEFRDAMRNIFNVPKETKTHADVPPFNNEEKELVTEEGSGPSRAGSISSEDTVPGNWTGKGTDVLYSALEPERIISTHDNDLSPYHNVSRSSGLDSKQSIQDLGTTPGKWTGEGVEALHGRSDGVVEPFSTTAKEEFSNDSDLATAEGAWVGDGPAAMTTHIAEENDRSLGPPPSASEESLFYSIPVHHYDPYRKLENEEAKIALQGKYLGGTDLFSSDAPSVMGRMGPSKSENEDSSRGFETKDYLHTAMGPTSSIDGNGGIDPTEIDRRDILTENRSGRESNLYSAMPALREQAAHALYKQQARDSLQKQARHYGGIAADEQNTYPPFRQLREDLRARSGGPADMWITQDPRSFGSRLQLLQEECVEALKLMNTIRVEVRLLMDLFEQADKVSSSIYNAVDIDRKHGNHRNHNHSTGTSGGFPFKKHPFPGYHRAEMKHSTSSDSHGTPYFKGEDLIVYGLDQQDEYSSGISISRGTLETAAWFLLVLLLYSVYYFVIETYCR